MKTTVICGGGLAGLSLGIALRKRGLPVELHEASHYPRHRVCGEFIAGAGAPLFNELGIASALEDALSLRQTVWHSGQQKVLIRQLPAPVTGISRYKLDERLSKIFQETGGMLYTGSRVENSADECEGRVWTCGRRPTVTGAKADGWIGLKCHASSLHLDGDLELHFGSRGYVGMSPVSPDRFNICGLFRLNRQLGGGKSELLLKYLVHSGLGHLAKRLKAAKIDADSFCAISGLNYRASPPDTRQLCLGDSFGLIAPLTGNGMSMAFESAALAVPNLEAWARNHCGWRETVEAITKKQKQAFSRRIRIARVLQRFLLHPCGQPVFRFLSLNGVLPFRTLYALTHND